MLSTIFALFTKQQEVIHNFTFVVGAGPVIKESTLKAKAKNNVKQKCKDWWLNVIIINLKFAYYTTNYNRY